MLQHYFYAGDCPPDSSTPLAPHFVVTPIDCYWSTSTINVFFTGKRPHTTHINHWQRLTYLKRQQSTARTLLTEFSVEEKEGQIFSNVPSTHNLVLLLWQLRRFFSLSL